MNVFKLGIVSDSHAMRNRIEDCAIPLKEADAVAHLGDNVRDAAYLADLLGKTVYSVCGNCDCYGDAPDEMLLEMEGKRVLLCHGHRYRVKQSLTALSLRAREAQADIALYGHTHIVSVQRDGDCLLINPGALQSGRYAILEFRENGPAPILYTLM